MVKTLDQPAFARSEVVGFGSILLEALESIATPEFDAPVACAALVKQWSRPM